MIVSTRPIDAGDAVFAALPEALGAGCQVRLVDARGVTLAQFGPPLAIDGQIECEAPIGVDGRRVVARVARERAPGLRALIVAAARAATERLRLESEMESVYAGSLQLLEEVAMTAEVLSRLSSCDSDRKVVRLGLESLLVGASVERAAWITFDHVSGRCTVELELWTSPTGGRPFEHEAGRGVIFDPVGTIVGRALRARFAGVIEPAASAPDLDLPEARARREVLALPVRFGDSADAETFGVLLAMDKRASSYAPASRLGSQENKMVANVAAMIGAAFGNRRAAEVGQELAFARAIQQQVLPAGAAHVPGFELIGRCETSGAVGGDYFDFVPMAGGRTLALVADVSGHNLASGMVMVGARAALRVVAARTRQPAEVLDGLAIAIHDDLARTERFITAVGLAIDPFGTGCEFVGAGHPDALPLRAADGRVERLSSLNAMLGFMRDGRHESRRIELDVGDVVVLYTDGVTEARSASEEAFDDQRLIEVLQAQRGKGARPVLDAVFAAVDAFRGDGARPADDLTVVVLRRLGAEEPR